MPAVVPVDLHDVWGEIRLTDMQLETGNDFRLQSVGQRRPNGTASPKTPTAFSLTADQEASGNRLCRNQWQHE